MMPVYRYMDSYPHQGNQVSAGPNYYPSFEAVPPRTNVDPSETIVINQPWPYLNSFGHSMQCYPFSSEGHLPGYYSHGFYPHSPAPQVHCCGHHPPFPGAFPVQYAPPPCYLKELPRYDYDKPRDHCCGCPNHSHYQKYGGGERIEVEKPKAGSKLGHSRVPFHLESNPYPVLWIPPEYMKNEEHKKPLESDGETQEKTAQDMKPPQNVKPNEQETKERQSWFPLDMKSLQPLLLGDDGKRSLDQQNEERMQQFPFPIIWMPPHLKQNEDDKEEKGYVNGSPTIVSDPVLSSDVCPVKLLNNGHDMSRAREVHANVSDQVSSEVKEKSANQRSIPVKQMEDISVNQRSIPVKQMEEKSTNKRIIPVKQMRVLNNAENSEGADRRGRSASPKKRDDHEVGKSSAAGARRGSSSPPKSKLPPVCLRVDPLPRKKSSSVSSRSPSPPGSTGKSQERTKEALKLPVMSDHKAQNFQDSEVRENTLSSSKEAEEKKSKGAVIQVVERMGAENKDDEPRNDSKTGNHVCSSADSSDQTMQQCEKYDVKSITEEDKGLESAEGSTIKQANEKQETNEESRSVGAAMKRDKKKLSVDEAACRIQSAFRGYLVRRWEPLKKMKQIAEVQEQMGELTKKIHGLESSSDLRKHQKQITFIGEMIMRLLLKLDTVQGLDPSFRNVRKSVARELVMLQEKLDLLAKAYSNEKPLDSEEEKSRDAEKYSTDDIPQSVNAVPNDQNEETSKAPVILKDEQTETVNDEQLVAMDIGFLSNESEGEVEDGKLGSTMMVEQDRVGDEESLQLLKPSGANGSLLTDNYAEVSDLEGSQAVISEEVVASAAEQMGTDVLEGRQSNEIDSSLTKGGESDTVAQVVEVSNELPVGLIEDEEVLQHEQAGLLENVLLHDGDVGEIAAVNIECQSKKEMPRELEEVADLIVAKQRATLELTAEAGGSYASPFAMEASNQNDSVQHRNDPEEPFVDGSDKVAPVVGSMELMRVEVEDNNLRGKEKFRGEQQETETHAPDIIKIVEMNEYLQETQQASPSLSAKGIGAEIQTKVDQVIIDPDRSCISEAKNATVSNPEEAKIGEDHGSLNQEQKTAVEEGKKLVEENEKMREMVEKLVACGREQLAAISNLTGRVHDLEKKLRRKTIKSRRCRPAVTSPSHTPSNPTPSNVLFDEATTF
ncbi:BAG family molecular chaperone regulator 6 [Euphorbia peplus]|nr:BAG family molecular chaperone regulator 6 [Euphorbia peplus]